MKTWLSFVIFALQAAAPVAGDRGYVLNFDLIIGLPDGSDAYRVHMEGQWLPVGGAAAKNFGKYEYSLRLAEVDDGNGTLTIFFYEYDSPEMPTKVISEFIADVAFTPESPAVYQAKTDTVSINLTFSFAVPPESESRRPILSSVPPIVTPADEHIGGAVRMSPHFDDGHLRGFNVYRGSNNAKFETLGFEPGDMIVEYDGTALNSITAPDFFQSLENSAIKFLTVKRGNGQIKVSLE